MTQLTPSAEDVLHGCHSRCAHNVPPRGKMCDKHAKNYWESDVRGSILELAASIYAVWRISYIVLDTAHAHTPWEALAHLDIA